MTPGYRQYLYGRYDVLGHIEFKNIDQDWCWFEQWLRDLHRPRFDSDQRIIIEHMDTDFYRSDLRFGMNLRNLFEAFRVVDIPLFTMLLFTNHFGIEREVCELAPDPRDRPTLIETFVNRRHVTEHYQEISTRADAVIMPALCLMGGSSRSHRYATYRWLEQSDLLRHVAVTMGDSK